MNFIDKFKSKPFDDYIIDLTNDQIVIIKYPNNILLNKSINELVNEYQNFNNLKSRYIDDKLGLHTLLWIIGLGIFKKPFRILKTAYFHSYNNISYGIFNYALKVIKDNNQSLLIKPRIIISVLPNLSVKEKSIIKNILVFNNVREIYFMERFLAVLHGFGLTKQSESSKIISLYITNNKCYRAIYFAGGLYDICELDSTYDNITNHKVEEYVVEIKSKSLNFPKDFKVLKKQNDLLSKLIRIWNNDFYDIVYVFFEANCLPKGIIQNNLISINYAISQLSILGMEYFIRQWILKITAHNKT